MPNEALKKRSPVREIETLRVCHEALSLAAKSLAPTTVRSDGTDRDSWKPFLSQRSVVTLIEQARAILFPIHFGQARLSAKNVEPFLESKIIELLENVSGLIVLSCQDECLRDGQPCPRCTESGRERALQFINTLAGIQEVLATDIHAALLGDPAARSSDEIILSYPGLFAVLVYRLAHKLHRLGVHLLPRMMTEHAHSLTGIDIHPGAQIGRSFFIDHGTGVVVGETTEIGNRVRIYQGVTLGALSLPRDAGNLFRDKKRHPTIENDVIIYSNATILGGKTVIGARSVIGGNVWLTESVPPDTKVLLNRPDLVYIGSHGNPESRPERVWRKQA